MKYIDEKNINNFKKINTSSWDSIKDNVYLRLMNKKYIDKYDENIAYKSFLDLAIVFSLQEKTKNSIVSHILTKKELNEEKQNEVDYINNLLRSKIAEAHLKPSNYNSKLLSPKKYSAFQKGRHNYTKNKKRRDIKLSNDKLKERIDTIKGYYSTKALIKQAKEDESYKMRICKTKGVYNNPHLCFKTPDEFKRQIEIKLESELMMEQFGKRPKTAKSARYDNTTTITTDKKTTGNTKETNVATCSSVDKQIGSKRGGNTIATISTNAPPPS